MDYKHTNGNGINPEAVNHINHCKTLHKKYIFKTAPFVFRLFDGTQPPYLPLRTPLLALSIPVQIEKHFLAQDGNSRALVTGRSLFRLPLSGTTFLLTPDTAVLSHSSKLLLKPFSSLLTTMRYSNPPTGNGLCTDCCCYCCVCVCVRA